uniref:Uncharacterized protein n=1 Tax=Ditylenchus dipsaci TaxID=166011 RepID=A0A915DFF5_9BILA
MEVDNCHARLHTNIASGQVVKRIGNHSCMISSAAFPLRRINQQVKWPPPVVLSFLILASFTIFNRILNNVPEAVQAKIDKLAVRKVVQRK